MPGRIEYRSAALRAWLMGAPMEAISILLGRDAEAEIRSELLELAQSEEVSAQASARRMKGNGRPAGRRGAGKLAKPSPDGSAGVHEQRKGNGRPASAESADGHGLVTWRDTIRTALVALGPATADEIVAHLHECGIERPRGAVTTTLHQLRETGEVERRGEQWVLNRM